MAESFPFPTYENGIVREAAVDEFNVPQNSCELAINVHFDRIGAVTRRLGTTLLGAQITGGTSILGMGSYQNNAGTLKYALAMIGTTVKYFDGANWTNARTGLVSGSRARFTSLVDYIFMVNGNGNDNCSTWAGSGSFGSTNVASLPKGDFIENYRNRIWIADRSNDKLYYSDVVTTANAITGGTAFLQISPADGEKITALKRHPRALLVFKQNHIYRVFSINSTDPDPSINRGTYSQESVIDAKDGIYYHHPTGFYKFVFDGDQEEISRPIIDIVQAIPRSTYESIVGWADDDHVYWSVGDVTVNGITISNCVVCRTISTKVWAVYSYPKPYRSAILYDNGTTLFQLLGDSNGNVLKFNVGNDDNGTPIFHDLMGHWSYFTTDRSKMKGMTKIRAFHENATGSNMSFQLDSDAQKNSADTWRPGGEFKQSIFDDISIKADNFIRMRPRLSGSSSGTPFIFRNFEAVDLVTSNP